MLSRVEPDVVGLGERPLDDPLGRLAIDAIESGDAAVRLTEPLRPSRQAPQGPRRRLRVVERGDPSAVAPQPGRDPRGAQHDGQHRLVPPRGPDGVVDGLRHLVGGRGDGRDEEHDHGVDLRLVE